MFDADVPQTAPADGLSPDEIAEVAETLAADSRNTGSTAVAVRDLDGTLLYEMEGEAGKVPASSIKVLTTAAALHELGPDTTLPTTAVVDGDRLHLVGGGDIYLSADSGDEGSTVGRAGLADLADQTAADLQARGISSVEVVVDSTLFSGQDYHENVEGADRQFIMPMRPIAIEAGRLENTYSAAPDVDAADRFAELLIERGIDVTSVSAGAAPAATAENTAGVVYSAPVRELIDYTLTVSDNSLAEVLAHLTAIERGLEADFDGSAKAVRDSLADQGFDTSGLIMSDAAGLSMDNRVSENLLTDVLAEAASCDCGLSPLPHGMPVAALSGTLGGRFVEMPAGGLVRAKTGTLIAANSLSGYVTTSGGEVYAFSILIDGIESGTTGIVRPAIDEAVNALARGGNHAG